MRPQAPPDPDFFTPRARQALEALEEAAPKAVERTLAWSAQNSGSYELEGLARMRSLLCDAFSALPGPLEILPLPPTQRVRADGALEQRDLGAALRITVRPEAPLQLALTGHYDTVFPAAHPFQTPWIEAGQLRGPGVADMKGGLGVMLDALLAFEAFGRREVIGYRVLLSPDEEIGSPGSAPLLAELGGHARFGMTYEPALPDGALVDARKGSGNYTLRLRGRAAHVGRAFEDGRNAVVEAARFAVALDALNGRIEGVTFNTGAIEGGGPVNMVPDGAVVRFNVRAPDADAADLAQAEVARLVEGVNEIEGITADLHGGFMRPAKPRTPAQCEAAAIVSKAGAAIGLDLSFRASGGVCEGNNLAAAGCPNIDTLGVVGGGLHSGEEFALIASFAERAQLSFALLEGFAQGRFAAPRRCV